MVHVSADATEATRSPSPSSSNSNPTQWGDTSLTVLPAYKARLQLATQTLTAPKGNELAIAPGMQVVAEINQGKRSVLEYLLSPVEKAVNEAGRER